MGRVNIFAKGNVDVHDSLVYARIGGEIRWNGINEVVRGRFPGQVVRVRHETWTRSDALLDAQPVPAELRARALPLGYYPADSQFGGLTLGACYDAVVLSIQPDVTTPLLRHRRDGYLFFPSGWEAWTFEDQRWLQEEFEDLGLINERATCDHLAQIVGEVRARLGAPVLVYNMSSVVPGEDIHCHQGLGEILSTRIRRFNLALIELSGDLGISVVDVDTVVARAGADRVKVDPIHLTPDGNRLVAEEVVRILHDLGCFEGGGAGGAR